MWGIGLYNQKLQSYLMERGGEGTDYEIGTVQPHPSSLSESCARVDNYMNRFWRVLCIYWRHSLLLKVTRWKKRKYCTWILSVQLQAPLAQRYALIKNKIKFSSCRRKLRREKLQSHIWLTASSYIIKNLRIFSCIRKPFLIYDFATAPFWISLYSICGKFYFYFYQCVYSIPNVA